MLQEVLVGLFFISALVYVGLVIYKSLRAQKGCASGCGKCQETQVKSS